MTPDMLGIIALRVSTPEQLKNYSVETQLQWCRDQAAAHNIVVPEGNIYIDDETGATLQRANIQQALDRLMHGEAKHLIVFDMSRLTRAPEDFLPLRRELHNRGISIHVAYERRILSTDPLEQVPDDIKAVFGKLERATFRYRSIEGRAKKIGSGKVPGNGPAPFGFSYEGYKRDRHLVINEAEASVIQQVVDWFLFGDSGVSLSVVAITKRLSELRIPTRADRLGRAKKLRGYGQWDVVTVNKLLRDASIAGTFYANRIQRLSRTEVRKRPRSEWKAIPIPAIIDEQTFDAVQRKLDEGRAMATRNNTRHFYLLRCRVRCTCGYALCGWARSGEDPLRYYRCISRNPGRKFLVSCELPYVRADVLEERTWVWLYDEALHPVNLQAQLDRLRATSQAERGLESALAKRHNIEAALVTNAAAMERLLAEIIRGRFPEAVIDTQLQALEAEKQHLHTQLAQIDTEPPTTPELSGESAHDLQSYAAIIREGMTDMTPAEQRRAIDMLDTRLVIGQQDGAIVADATCALRLDAVPLLIAKQTRTD